MAARERRMQGAWAGAPLLALLMTCGAAEALAQTGINLAWDDCSQGVNFERKTFACNTNTGAPFTLYGSFAPPAGVTDFVGASATLSVEFDVGVPDWWKHGAGLCRGAGTLSANFDFSVASGACLDPNQGQAAGSMLYEAGFGIPERSRIRVVYALPSSARVPLDEGVEQYAFKINLTRARTTGAGACAGCTVPATITLEQVQLFQPYEIGFDPVLTAPLVTNVAYWQADPVMVTIDATDLTEPFAISGGSCLAPGQVHHVPIPIGANDISGCGNLCGTGSPPVTFNVDAGGVFSYAPIQEGPLGGAGTTTLDVNSFSFPPPGDELEPSMGLFRIVVEPEFWTLMNGYPGYDVVGGVHRLVSPRLFDGQTRIGRSAPHRHGDASDVGGTPVGTAGTNVSDAHLTAPPPGFQGPANTLEIHTEIRSLNMTGTGPVAVRAGTHAPSRPISPGEIEAGDGVVGLFPANSFFNVNVEVDLPLLGTLYNTAPLVVEHDDIECFPPQVVYLHRHTGPVPVAFKHDDTQLPKRWLANQQFGWLVLAGHGINFDTLAAVAKRGVEANGDPFAAFEAIVNAEPEMSDTATALVDLQDVVTSAPGGAFTAPENRDDLLDGIAQAAALGQSGDPCAGTALLIDLYQRVDGVSDPDDWVTDSNLRATLRERITVLGAHLQAQANQSGGCLPTGVDDQVAPARLAILGIQPNPTSGAATIQYALPRPGRVQMSVFDLGGRLVQELIDADLPAGTHRATWDGSRYRVGGPRASSGTYFVRLNLAGEVQVKRLVLLR